MERFDRSHGVSYALRDVLSKAHQDDRVILTKAVGAVLSFHELSKMIDRLEWNEGLSIDELSDVLDDMKDVRVGFELALRALDAALADRAKAIGRPSAIALGRWKNAPQSLARESIKAEYDRWCSGETCYNNAAHFAVCMHAKHASAYKNERSIQALVSKWGGAPNKNHNAA
jgi:hypothetical protein